MAAERVARPIECRPGRPIGQAGGHEGTQRLCCVERWEAQVVHHLIKLLARHGHKAAPHAHRAATHGTKTAQQLMRTSVRAPITPHKAMWTQGGKIVTRKSVPPGI
jgi:hypothetical protein